MKISFVIPTLSNGGAEKVMINIMNYLAKKNYNVELILFNNNNFHNVELSKSIKVVNLETNKMRYSFFKLIKFLRKNSREYIFSSLGYVNLSLLLIKILFSKKIKLILREANLPSKSINNNKFSYLFHIGYFILYRKCDKLIVTSELMKKEFLNKYKVSKNKICLINNPLDVENIRKKGFNIKKLDNDCLHLVSSGRLVKQKGFKRLIILLSNLNRDFRLYILGQGEEYADLKKLIDKLSLKDKVFIVGHVSNPWEWYGAADAMLISSFWEGLPNNALECLACGTFVLATPDSGGLVDLSKNLSNDFLKISKFGNEYLNEIYNLKKLNKSKLNKSFLPINYDVNYIGKEIESLF